MTSSIEAEEESHAMTEEKTPRKVKNYSLSDIFPYKLFTVTEDCKLKDFCKKNGLDSEVFANLNGFKLDEELRLGEVLVHCLTQQIVVVPIYFKYDPCIDMTVTDLRKYNLEERLMSDPATPTFYVYYATVHGDILGNLILTDYEMIFDPLNEKFKGILSYEFSNILDNYKMGFILSYLDICGEPSKISVPEDDTNPMNTEMTYDVQIGLKHTGFLYHTDQHTKDLIQKQSSAGHPLATFNLKINTHSLTGDVLSSEKRSAYADKLIQMLKLKIFDLKSKINLELSSLESTAKNDQHEPVPQQKETLEHKKSEDSTQASTSTPKESHSEDLSMITPKPRSKSQSQQLRSMTSIPFFDISYKSILQALGETYNETEEPTLAQVQKHLDCFKKIFGLTKIGDSIISLKNQSIVPLEWLFEEVEMLRREELDKKGGKDTDLLHSVEEQEPMVKKHSTRVFDLDKMDKQLADKLLPESEILSLGHIKLVSSLHLMSARKRHSELHLQ